MEAALEGISDKVPKGQGEEPPPPRKSQQGTWVKAKKPGRPGKVSGV